MSKRKVKVDKPEKVQKTDEELAKGYLGRTEGHIQAIEKRMEKLGKAMTSRKYPMSETQTQYALEYLTKIQDKFVQTLQGKTESKPDFKLPE